MILTTLDAASRFQGVEDWSLSENVYQMISRTFGTPSLRPVGGRLDGREGGQKNRVDEKVFVEEGVKVKSEKSEVK